MEIDDALNQFHEQTIKIQTGQEGWLLNDVLDELLWLCELVMTSMPVSKPGSMTRSVTRVCGLSVVAYFFVSESER